MHYPRAFGSILFVVVFFFFFRINFLALEILYLSSLYCQTKTVIIPLHGEKLKEILLTIFVILPSLTGAKAD